ncbi:hypothetical protein MVG78_15500 [Roseomonas gilardii subsp. gilardii]|uniref:hypothetical protein n=1 Tax=Roseomonas gilardii TaxID=257708 RepID=UPI001FF95458|nr:hypothetical protein [Roseomonas gilardii]UPG71927.1 hypothetical protein MVG78_15500 [Roseomonas gilardii subsp. gilardii]
MSDRVEAFLARLGRLPQGYSEGRYAGRRYGVTLASSGDGRRRWLYGEELGGTGRISCNIYLGREGKALLRPCEMPLDEVIDFVLGFRAVA